jgi:hypothetical protein
MLAVFLFVRDSFLALLYGPAARCKPKVMIWRSWVLRFCIRPLNGTFCVPGHHGYPRALDLIRVSAPKAFSRNDPCGNVVVEREDHDRGLADSEGGSSNDRKQETFEALAGPRQFGRDAWRAGMTRSSR